jgi:hypothetical protein
MAEDEAVNLRDVFDLTGQEFDLAEAYWEIENAATSTVAIHPYAFLALALETGFPIGDGYITCISPLGMIRVTARDGERKL